MSETYETLDRLTAAGWVIRIRGSYSAIIDPPAGSWGSAQRTTGASISEALRRLDTLMEVTDQGKPADEVKP